MSGVSHRCLLGRTGLFCVSMYFVLSILLTAACPPPQPAESSFEGIAQSLGEGIARFYAEGVEPTDLPPSFAFEGEPQVAGALPGEWTVVPTFELSEARFTATISVTEGTSLYGTGEIAGPLLRNGYDTQAWNTDAFNYDRTNTELYQSHPWVLAVREDGTSFGVLADTTYRCSIDLRKNIEFSTAGRPFAVVVFTGDSPQRVLTRAASLMGTMPLPPRWALGYHQCRWSYYPDSRVREIADEFRARRIPCDVIWLDIHYMHDYRIFTFDPERFPDPRATNDYLHEKGFKSVWMIDPGVKAEQGYFVYDRGATGGHWVLDSQGNEYNGEVWPGLCAFPDFTRPETREWWAGLYKDFLAFGVDGVWNDMNEPSVFNVESRTMPEDNIHRGGGGLPRGPHAQYHNVYGMLMVSATREGILHARPEVRPFVLTRANYIGGHRHAATWTGDNQATWEHLEDSVPMILNLGLSLQPFSGPDIGGFSGEGDGDQFARWMGVGAFFPFARGHAAQNNRDKEPWAFGPDVEAACRTALERRYRLLPYLYTLFREASVTGLPVMRPVFFANPADPALRAEDDAFLLGADLLVVPRLDPDAQGRPAIPKGIWLPFTLVGENPDEDITQPELRIRGGAIIPLGRIVQCADEESLDPLTLIVCLDGQDRAEGRLYEDAGDGFAYRDGEYLLTTYEAVRNGDAVTVRVAGEGGAMPRPRRAVVVRLVTPDGVFEAGGDEVQGITLNCSIR